MHPKSTHARPLPWGHNIHYKLIIDNDRLTCKNLNFKNEFSHATHLGFYIKFGFNDLINC